ncbi:MAG: hypothetical protein NC548_28670 [Lachnospiraceae bacterium]|nr:hypothetical protein [Lachnospiraceae bacterium]
MNIEIQRMSSTDKEQGFGSEPPKRYSVHAIVYVNLAWVIVILGVIICYLMSIDITKINSKELLSLITNFATLLSIILSISSILFAYFTSRDTSNQYISMGKALEEIRANNNQITQNNSNLVSQVTRITENVTSLNNKYDIQELLSQIRNISTTIKEMPTSGIPNNNPGNNDTRTAMNNSTQTTNT